MSAAPTVDTNTASQRRINSKFDPRKFRIRNRINAIHSHLSTDLTSTNSIGRPVSAPVISNVTTENASDRVKDASVISADVTVSLKKNRSSEDKGQSRFRNRILERKLSTISFTENEKDNDSRGGQATQALIQRRRRPKRRSTGVCNVSAEDSDGDRQDSPVDGDEVNIDDFPLFTWQFCSNEIESRSNHNKLMIRNRSPRQLVDLTKLCAKYPKFQCERVGFWSLSFVFAIDSDTTFEFEIFHRPNESEPTTVHDD